MSYYAPWTAADDTLLFTLRNNSVSYKEIARRIGRTPRAIDSRLRYRERAKSVPNPQPVFNERVAIPHCDVPKWYEAGWRFIGFNDDKLCIFEWHSLREVRWP